MTVKNWNNIVKYDDFTRVRNLPVGTKFLCGKHMLNQDNKEISDRISYYEVIENKVTNISYIIKMENLEE